MPKKESQYRASYFADPELLTRAEGLAEKGGVKVTAMLATLLSALTDDETLAMLARGAERMAAAKAERLKRNAEDRKKAKDLLDRASKVDPAALEAFLKKQGSN